MNLLFYFCMMVPSLLLSVEEPPFSICIFVNYFSGELEFAHRVERACDHLGWGVEICDIDKKPRGNHDCSMILVPAKAEQFDRESYLVLFSPHYHFFDGDHLKKKHLHHLGYLATYEDRTLLLKDVPAKKIYPYPWYPTVQSRPYVKVKPEKLFYILSTWSDRRDNPRYRLLLNCLAETGYAHYFINDKKIGQEYGKAYRGSIPFDGETILKTISEMGVCLVLHSQTHLHYGIPSGRIFEAAAASAVIISDRNSFVMDHFGDSVLYVDHTATGITMFNQINQHMRWIRNHPKAAAAMAYRAHNIFEERFLLEQQLLELRNFHEKRMREEKR